VEEQAAQADGTAFAARVLVVDDAPEIRELLQIHLQEAGYQVLTASNGQEALAAVAAEAPDLILLDVMMPVLDGYETCRRLKANEDTALIPIVILTAHQDFAHRLRGIELGADGFLSKPFNQLELMTRIRSLLRVKGLHDQVDSSSTRQHGGTGLGLAIVKRILDAHEAPIAVESLPGQGTTFSLRLPVAA